MVKFSKGHKHFHKHLSSVTSTLHKRPSKVSSTSWSLYSRRECSVKGDSRLDQLGTLNNIDPKLRACEGGRGVTCPNGIPSCTCPCWRTKPFHEDEQLSKLRRCQESTTKGLGLPTTKGLGFPSIKAAGQWQGHKLTCTTAFERGGFQGSCWVSSTMWIPRATFALASWKLRWFALLWKPRNENLNFKWMDL